MKWLPDRIKAESLARLGLCLLGSYCLGVAEIPKVVPPAFSFFVTLVGTALSFSLPSLFFRIPGLLPSVIVAFVLASVYSTMLLAAATVSDGLFVAIFAIFCLLMVSLFFGPHYDKTVALANVQIGIAAMLALSHFEAVEEEERQGDDGLSAIGDLWTERGTTNPNAFYRNFLIAVCWGVALLAFVVLLPPIRTARNTLSAGVLPGALHLVAALIGGKLQQVQGKFIHIWTIIAEGTIANMILFEPRPFRAPAESLVPSFKELMVQTDALMLYSLLASTWKKDVELSEPEKAALKETLDIVNGCASALSSNDPDSIKTLEDTTPSESVEGQNGDEHQHHESARLDETWFVHKQAVQVRDATIVWLKDLHLPKPPESCLQGMKHIGTAWTKIFLLTLLPLERVASASTLVLKPKSWDWWSFLWGLKLVVGFTVLFIMRVYWKAYANYAIRPDDGFVGNVFSGWELLTFAFSWSVTLEGTCKKGVQRMLGTAFGGFIAWLGIIVCSWSYDDDASINPYGLVAWLTVTNLLAANFDLLPGIPSRLGAAGYNCTHAWGFFAVTNALIAMETYTGKGTKNDLTANRVVATLTGVLTAMIVALIPPFVRGGDPKHARKYLSALEEAYESLLKTSMDEDGFNKIDQEDYKATFLLPATKLRKAAVFFWTDAARFKRLPVYNVQEELKPLLDEMAVTQALIGFLRAFLALSADDDEESSDVSRLHKAVDDILESLGADDGKEEEEEQASNKEDPPADRTSRQIALASTIRDRLKSHKIEVNHLRDASGPNPWA